MKFPGLKTSPERSIASFLAETRAALKPYKAFLGASVFGVAATRPTEVAQDIPMMAEHVDYVSAMVYPVALGARRVRSAEPERAAVRHRCSARFRTSRRTSAARRARHPVAPGLLARRRLRPGAGRRGDPGDPRRGIDEFLLWDPSVTYTAAALSTDAEKAKFPTKVKATFTGTGKPDELGVVPVLMHHQLRLHGSAYDLTPSQFLGELTRLWRDGF